MHLKFPKSLINKIVLFGNYMLIISGPTASGKNTGGHLLASQRERCAVVDFDLVRQMFVKPHQPPWAGEEGKSQQFLGVKQVCSLAENFDEAGWEVIILDVLSTETVKIYRHLLSQKKLKIVQFLPAFEELKQRFYQRGACLSDDELKMVYDEQSDYTDYNLRIDNTFINPDELTKMISHLL